MHLFRIRTRKKLTPAPTRNGHGFGANVSEIIGAFLGVLMRFYCLVSIYTLLQFRGLIRANRRLKRAKKEPRRHQAKGQKCAVLKAFNLRKCYNSGIYKNILASKKLRCVCLLEDFQNDKIRDRGGFQIMAKNFQKF